MSRIKMGNFVWSKNEIRIFIGWLKKVKILPQPVAEFKNLILLEQKRLIIIRA